MTKVYIQFKEGLPCRQSGFASAIAFRDMGFEIIPFDPTIDGIPETECGDILVGGMGVVRQRLHAMGRGVPDLDYPDELSHYLGRRIWKSTIDTVSSSSDTWPVFVKPCEGKRFTGRLVKGAGDLLGLRTTKDDADIYCSDPVNFLREWRCFVLNGQILDIMPYRGDWRCHYDPKIPERMVSEFRAAPAGYVLDIGMTDDGRTLLVEANDGYSLGTYGLEPHKYARLIAARWAELAGFDDPCDFGRFESCTG